MRIISNEYSKFVFVLEREDSASILGSFVPVA
jgi:hypothetical protein